jgi:hypothetical protein
VRGAQVGVEVFKAEAKKMQFVMREVGGCDGARAPSVPSAVLPRAGGEMLPTWGAYLRTATAILVPAGMLAHFLPCLSVQLAGRST